MRVMAAQPGAACYDCWLPSLRAATMSDDNTPSKQRRIEELIFVTIPHVASGVLFVLATGINIVNVVGRYVFSVPLFWAEEVLVFIVIWTVFLLAGSITYRGAHLNMDLLYSGFNAFWKWVINIAIALTLIGCSAFTVTQSWKVIALHIRTGGVTAATEIPLWIPHIAILFGFSFMALAAIVRFRSYVAGKFD
jgi:TRAP-type C4-dicarboxylate transport system permease small subunit